MKVQSIIFVLFLVATTLAATPSQANPVAFQPQQEQQAAQEAYQLGQDIQQRETDLNTAYKNEHCSADALHWTFVSANQGDQSPLPVDQHLGTDAKGPAVKTIDRPATIK
jgi:hypothetical protein